MLCAVLLHLASLWLATRWWSSTISKSSKQNTTNCFNIQVFRFKKPSLTLPFLSTPLSFSFSIAVLSWKISGYNSVIFFLLFTYSVSHSTSVSLDFVLSLCHIHWAFPSRYELSRGNIQCLYFVGRETLLSGFRYNFNYLRKKMLGKIYLCWAKYLFKTRKTAKPEPWTMEGKSHSLSRSLLCLFLHLICSLCWRVNKGS